MTDAPLFPIFVRKGRSRTHYNVGYINNEGKVVIEPIFNEGTRFYGGLAAVSLKGRWGIINASGNFVVQPKLWSWCRFDGGLAGLANRSGKWGIIDREGNSIIQPKYDYVGPFRNDRALFRMGELSNARFGYVDRKGDEVIPAVFHDACGFSEGLAAAKVGNLWGYIDPSSLFKITPRFESTRQGAKRVEDTRAGYFVNGLAPVWLGTGYGFVNAFGNTVIEGSFDEAKSFCEGRALVKRQRRYGFVDRSGKMAIKAKFTRAHNFSEGLAAVAEKESAVGFVPPWGFIDSEGNMVLEPTFYSAHEFRDGLCLVETKDSIGYIDRSGKFAWQGPYVEYGVVL
jgi:hypothetical protein